MKKSNNSIYKKVINIEKYFKSDKTGINSYIETWNQLSDEDRELISSLVENDK